MDLSQIKELLRIVAESGVAEVEVEEGEFKLVVRKSAPTLTMQALPMQALPMAPPYGMGYYAPPYPPAPYPSAPYPPSLPAAASAAPSESPAGEADAGEAPPAAPPRPAADEVVVRAPIVGTFYSAPSPEADPFVAVGQHVEPGDPLCIIEAMKLMNEIECETAGRIKQILVANAQPVEYDQPLFIIEKA